MIASHSMRLGKKNSSNLEQLDYLQDLNRLLFSNVVDQTAQKTEYYLAYYIWGGDKQASGSFKNHWHTEVFFSTLTLSATNVHRHVSDGFNDTNKIGGDFHKSLVNYMVLDFLCNSSSPFFFPKINIAASENRHVGCNSMSLCPLLVPNIFIKKTIPQ